MMFFFFQDDDLLDLTMVDPESIAQNLPAELSSSPIQSFSPLSSSPPNDFTPSPNSPRGLEPSLVASPLAGDVPASPLALVSALSSVSVGDKAADSSRRKRVIHFFNCSYLMSFNCLINCSCCLTNLSSISLFFWLIKNSILFNYFSSII